MYRMMGEDDEVVDMNKPQEVEDTDVDDDDDDEDEDSDIDEESDSEPTLGEE